MKFLILLASFALSFNAFSDYCVKEKDVTISWKAFKTPAKVGVGGKFSDFKLIGKKKGTSIKDVAYGMSVEIDSDGIDTGNKARDKKIAKFFFSTMAKGKKIKASIDSIKSKTLNLALEMNGQNRDIPMSYTVLGNELKAKGFIDVLDFAMSDELKAINKACYALHEGKTWSDVEIELSANFSKCK